VEQQSLTLPFPEANEEQVRRIAADILSERPAGSWGYTEEQAMVDARMLVDFNNAIDSGFLQTSGKVNGRGISFTLSKKEEDESPDGMYFD
jgi:hypothetical protein